MNIHTHTERNKYLMNIHDSLREVLQYSEDVLREKWEEPTVDAGCRHIDQEDVGWRLRQTPVLEWRSHLTHYKDRHLVS